jgi:DNA (cytosine-5)-methyltransferase 1
MGKESYITVSLFSGGMGLDLGLEAGGRFLTRACIEKVPSFCDTIRRNRDANRLFKNLVVFEKDICELDPLEILAKLDVAPGDVDLLVGGPPCQSFSTAGRRRTVQDPRGTLLWQFLGFIEAMRPKFFLLENVRGLLSAALHHRPIALRPEKGGLPLDPDEEAGAVVKLFSRDLQAIPAAAYHMDIFEVNAVNYGAPQIRERALLIGNRYNTQVDFPDPTHGMPGATDAPATLFDFDNRQRRLPWATLRDAIGDLRETHPIIMDFSPRKKRYLDMVPPGSNWRSLPEAIQKESMGKAWIAKGGRSGWWRRLTYDLPCPTLVTMPNHASTSLCHPTETRALTVREYARIQEFPDDWEFVGTTSEQYTQVGNAVPTRLGRVAGNVIAACLDELRERDWRPYPRPPAAYRKIYIESHVRTRQWYKDGEIFVWEDDGDNGDAAYAAPKTRRKVRNLA